MPTITAETANKSTKKNKALDYKDKRFKVLDMTIKRNQNSQNALIEILHKTQESFGYLEKDVLAYIARQLKLPLSRVYGVATFYHLFCLKPQGEHTCVVCLGTACYVKGAKALLDSLDQECHLHPGETTPDGKVSLVTARCIGACGIAPAAVFDSKVVGKQTSATVLKNIKHWQTMNHE